MVRRTLFFIPYFSFLIRKRSFVVEYVIPIAAGIALSAATGFRIFMPFFVLSLAALGGYVDLAPGFA